MAEIAEVGTYLETFMSGKGNVYLKILENQTLGVSQKPLSIFTMSGQLSLTGTKPTTKEKFDELFNRASFELLLLKNS